MPDPDCMTLKIDEYSPHVFRYIHPHDDKKEILRFGIVCADDMISIVDFTGFEPDSDSDRSDIHDIDDEYYEDYEERYGDVMRQRRDNALSVRKAVSGKAVSAICVSHPENEPFPMTVIPLGRQTVPKPLVVDKDDKKSQESSQTRCPRQTAPMDVWEIETGYSEENHFPWRRYVIARPDGSIWTPEDHDRSWLSVHIDKKTDSQVETPCSWDTGRLQKALDIVPKPALPPPPVVTNAWDRPLHSQSRAPSLPDEESRPHHHRTPPARLSILRPAARPSMGSAGGEDRRPSNAHPRHRALPPRPPRPPSIPQNPPQSSVVPDGNGRTESAHPRPHAPPRERHAETSVTRARSESGRRPTMSSSTDPRPDLLCRLVNTPQHIARDHCMRSHSLDEWKLRNCRRPHDCRRKECGFYHPDREDVRQFLERLCKIEGTFYGNHAQDFYRIYLSPMGRNRTRK